MADPVSHPTTSHRTVSRRTVLTGGLGVLGGAAGGAALALLGSQEGGGSVAAPATTELPAPDAVGQAVEPFHGSRQAGVTTVPQGFVSLVALDLVPGADRETVRRVMRIWTDDARRLTQGDPGLTDTEPELATSPARLTVTVGVGTGVFTAAGLEGRRPSWLAPLPAFTVDRLEDRWSGGDLVVQVCADDPVTVAHASRLLCREVRDLATVRWVQNGFRNPVGVHAPGTTMRNLFGQVDGTVQPDVTGVDAHLLWVGDDQPEATAWLAGGSSMVVRRITTELDTWDEVDRGAREQIVGRDLRVGAPLTGTAEHDEPDFEAVNAIGFPVIDVASHVRRSRSEDTSQRFLRRAYNYDLGVPGDPDAAGLVFITFQADPVAQYVPVQRRLDEMDLLNQWTTPIGSAVFAVLPGCAEGEYLGQALLA